MLYLTDQKALYTALQTGYDYSQSLLEVWLEINKHEKALFAQCSSYEEYKDPDKFLSSLKSLVGVLSCKKKIPEKLEERQDDKKETSRGRLNYTQKDFPGLKLLDKAIHIKSCSTENCTRFSCTKFRQVLLHKHSCVTSACNVCAFLKSKESNAVMQFAMHGMSIQTSHEDSTLAKVLSQRLLLLQHGCSCCNRGTCAVPLCVSTERTI